MQLAFRVAAISGAMAIVAGASAQDAVTVVRRTLTPIVDSGELVNAGSMRAVIFSKIIAGDSDVPWMRLRFRTAKLGTPVARGLLSQIRLTSLHDGATQHLDSLSVAQWRHSSAYFNGGSILIEVIADPGAAPSRVVIDGIELGATTDDSPSVSCTVDNRETSDDPRIARTAPPFICTVWMIDDDNHCFLSAGHCFDDQPPSAVHFNVPPTTPGGALQFPPPEHQYSVDARSIQFTTGLEGDWGYFGCFPNSETGLTPFEGQKVAFSLAKSIPANPGHRLRLTGYGNDSTPVTADNMQQTRINTLTSYIPSTWSLRYKLHSAGGDSGGPLIDEDTGLAIGIHSSSGCEFFGWNAGNAVVHPGLQTALARPQGICATLNPADLNSDGDVDGFDLALLLSQWGPCGEPCPADLNGDGAINGVDLAMLLASWG